MGYDTTFKGKFELDKELDNETYNLLVGLNTTRRMKRNIGKEFGIDGEFYIKGEGMYEQNEEDNIVDYNTPPLTQPGLWLQWRPTEDKKGLEWDGNEKFYEYIEWLEYLITKILKPRGYILNGEVEWIGEDDSDLGLIVVKDNVVTTKEGVVTYDEKEPEEKYNEIRNKIVNEFPIDWTMRLVTDLLGNLKDLEEEKEMSEEYEDFKFNLNEITKDWN